MKTTIFEQAQAQTGLSAENLENFLIFYVQESARYACATRSETNFSWELPGGSNIERRLLLSYDAAQSCVTISFEVAYQLFDGDTHFFVKKAGTATPAEFGKPLSAIVTAALQELTAWKPSYEIFRNF